MDQPSPTQPPPDLEITPPKLNTRILWLTLLLPMALTGIFMALMASAGSGKGEETFLNLGTIIVALASIACWVAFAKCIAERFVGTSRVLLILAYPVIQAVLVFCTFFVGCLVMLQTKGFH